MRASTYVDTLVGMRADGRMLNNRLLRLSARAVTDRLSLPDGVITRGYISGGYYRETYRSSLVPPEVRWPCPTFTAIYYLLTSPLRLLLT